MSLVTQETGWTGTESRIWTGHQILQILAPSSTCLAIWQGESTLVITSFRASRNLSTNLRVVARTCSKFKSQALCHTVLTGNAEKVSAACIDRIWQVRNRFNGFWVNDKLCYFVNWDFLYIRLMQSLTRSSKEKTLQVENLEGTCNLISNVMDVPRIPLPQIIARMLRIFYVVTSTLDEVMKDVRGSINNVAKRAWELCMTANGDPRC